MKDFDEQSYCPKCHSVDVCAVYYPQDETRRYGYGNDVTRETKEHIRRQCPRCHYQWNEAPLDARAAMGESDDAV